MLHVNRATFERSVGRPLLLVPGGGRWLELERRWGGAGAGASTGAGSSNRVPWVTSNCYNRTTLVPGWVVAPAVHTPLLAPFPLLGAVSLSSIVCYMRAAATPSLVAAVSCNIAELVALIAPLYLGSCIERLSIKVLSLKDYTLPIHFLCRHHATHIQDHYCMPAAY
ncbi:hypothetical protein OIDMADRAFT_62535 [Oidiodendron maius Zn]|uniref:Uncharacterized protein n=1 Tax=Oidiodendron maius (strain Zn) TaxID=913774 RepID=A0A0C3G8F1_OIDMZ|nr:hypothetical protein OIDMADRAFT_62535 [Oidiodendron maius Zn]